MASFRGFAAMRNPYGTVRFSAVLVILWYIVLSNISRVPGKTT